MTTGTVLKRRGPEWLVAGFVSFAIYLVLRYTLDGSVILADFLIVTPSVGLAIPLGVLLGYPAAVGLLCGALAVALAHSVLSFWTLFEALSLFVLALVSSLAWGVHVGPDERAVGGLAAWLSFASLTLVVSTGAAAFLGWAGELLGLFPFYVTFPETLLRYVLATAVVAPPLVIAATRTRTWAPHERMPNTEPSTPSKRNRWGFVLVPLVWALLAVTGSIGFSIRERFDRTTLQDLGFEFLYHWVHPDVFGQGGRRVQVVFGALMFTAWLATLTATRARTTTAGNDAANPAQENPSTHGEEPGGVVR